MASFESIKAVTMIADSSILTGDLYRVVKITGVDTVGRAVLATDTPLGILAENPAPSGAAGAAQNPILQGLPVVMIDSGGRMKVKAGGTVTAGQLLIVDSAGRVTGVANQAALAADTTAIGVALTSGVINEIIEVALGRQTSSTET